MAEEVKVKKNKKKSVTTNKNRGRLLVVFALFSLMRFLIIFKRKILLINFRYVIIMVLMSMELD